MRSIFFGFVSVLATSYAFGGEDMPSVLKNESAPTAVVASPACENNCASRASQPQLICVNGRCGEQKLYSVDAREQEHSRNRLLGGKVIRRHSRTVVRPVR